MVSKTNKTNKKSQTIISKIFFFLIIIILLIILGLTAYFTYVNIPRSPETLDINISKTTRTTQKPITTEAKQFYPNMKFNHNQITYRINQDCDQEKQQNILLAFNELSQKINLLIFQPTTKIPDIEISCTKSSEESESYEAHFIAGEGGAKEIIPTQRYHIITKGIIYLYQDNARKTVECDYPNVELHELMHVFGFDHVDEKSSLMYPILDDCNQRLDESIIQELKKLYSEPNLPDFYFENISVIKKGKYLDFNLTIKNSGSVNSPNATLTIIDNTKVIEEKDLGELSFGSGITLQIANLRLKHLNPDKIEFVIDRENKVEEIDEGNNVASVELG